jgi:hypothetical protein
MSLHKAAIVRAWSALLVICKSEMCKIRIALSLD